jgi:catechol 2,3-dioxygenase-like lactoylglutathione lyase family enzyme
MDKDPVEIDHVQLAAPAAKPPDLAKRGGVWFRSGTANLHLGVDPEFVSAKKAHPPFRCADYDELLARLTVYGIAITPDALPLDGKRHCYVADPFGNRIELIES